MAKIWISRFLHSPFALQLTCLALLVLVTMSFRPPNLWNGQNFGDDTFSLAPDFPITQPGFLQNTIGVNTAGLREILVEDENGNLVKKAVSKKREKTIEYTIKSGDNVSKIAHRFGLKVSTLLWGNGLNIKQTLSVGEKIRIPPTDGVYYNVKSGETLGEIAKVHEIDIAKIQAYNPLKNNVIKVDQELFLPEAKKIFVRAKAPRASGSGTPTIASGGNTSSLGSIGFRMRRPTQGVMTQGYKNGHYAIDIASKLNTPIYAAADGVVIKESHSGWNYGYGRYIVIDHGNGIETLYAHNNVTKVGVGENVRKGQLIALMGNTGRVFGRTGIHLHFELRIRGRKVNPNNYF